MDSSAPILSSRLPAFLEDARRPDDPQHGSRVLQVHQLWGDVLMESRAVEPGMQCCIGEGVGWRWRLLGVDLGPAPPALRKVLPWVAPGWSEVSAEPLAELTVPDLEEVHALIAPTDDGWVARTDPSWPVCLVRDGSTFELQALLEAGAARPVDGVVEIPVLPDQRLIVQLGATRVAIWSRYREAPAPRAGWLPDPVSAATFSTLAAAAALFGLVVATSPGTPDTSLDEVMEQFAEIALSPPPPPPEPIADAGGSGPAEPQDDEPEPLPEDATPEEQRAHDEEVVSSSGLIAALEAGAFGGLFDDAALDSRLASAAGSLAVAKGGGGPGSWGLGGRGSLTGGGSAVGIGLCEGDQPCRSRHGSGYGAGTGPGKEDGDLGTMESGDPITVGGLPKSAVDEVVKNHLKAIQYCYQRQLQRSPEINGKVVVKFTISGDGSVSDARVQRTTLADDATESCIASRFMRMTFPEPGGNGIVVVSYPFLFHPG